VSLYSRPVHGPRPLQGPAKRRGHTNPSTRFFFFVVVVVVVVMLVVIGVVEKLAVVVVVFALSVEVVPPELVIATLLNVAVFSAALFFDVTARPT